MREKKDNNHDIKNQNVDNELQIFSNEELFKDNSSFLHYNMNGQFLVGFYSVSVVSIFCIIFWEVPSGELPVVLRHPACAQ